jgi:hypothetical protein
MRRVLTIITGGVFATAFAVWGLAIQVNTQMESVVHWWPYDWLWVLAGVTAAAFVVWLVLMLHKPKCEDKKHVQLYRRALRHPDGKITNDARLYERREHEGTSGIPDWDVAPNGTMQGPYIANRSRDEPFVIAEINRWPDADRDFTPIRR